jgi:hypothetical protein
MAVIELVLDDNYKPEGKDKVESAKGKVAKPDSKQESQKSNVKSRTSKVERRASKPKSAEKVTTKITSGRKGSK